jgi:hypothetical protein
MTTFFDCLANLSEQELLDHFAGLVARDRRTTAELLVAIAEIDERKLWAAHACSSMFTFCMERFHMSEPVTAKRIWAARTARRFPVVLDMVARGDLHLGAIHLLAKHLTEENHASVLERAKHKSCREVERLIAGIAPRADVPSRIRALPGAGEAGRVVDGLTFAAFGDETSACNRAGAADGPAAAATADGASSDERSTSGHPTGAGDRRAPADGDPTASGSTARLLGTRDSRSAAKPIVALSPRRYKIEITVDEATHDRLRSLQDLLARSGTGRDPAAIISRAIEELLVRTLARKAACTDRPKAVSSTRIESARAAESSMPAGSAIPAESARAAGSATPAKSAIPAESATPAESSKPSRTSPRGPATSSPGAATSGPGKRSRTIPAAVRREVWRRDSGRCGYVDIRGRRCGETSNVEFHHKFPFALGGLSTTDNIELRCAAHNQLQADLDFGRAFMDARRGKAAAA